MLQSAAPIPEEQIRRAVTQAFRGHTFARESLPARFWRWLGKIFLEFWHWLMGLFEAVGISKPISMILVILAVLAAAAIIARTIWVWRGRSRIGLPAGSAGGGLFRAEDPWARAQALAAAGDHTAAAHALYGALLESAARGQQVRLHPSKTVGDYGRELRARRSPLSPRFRDFAGDYQVVIYGDQSCDAERYDRLFALAVPMLRAHG